MHTVKSLSRDTLYYQRIYRLIKRRSAQAPDSRDWLRLSFCLK